MSGHAVEVQHTPFVTNHTIRSEMQEVLERMLKDLAQLDALASADMAIVFDGGSFSFALWAKHMEAAELLGDMHYVLERLQRLLSQGSSAILPSENRKLVAAFDEKYGIPARREVEVRYGLLPGRLGGGLADELPESPEIPELPAAHRLNEDGNEVR